MRLISLRRPLLLGRDVTGLQQCLVGGMCNNHVTRSTYTQFHNLLDKEMFFVALPQYTTVDFKSNNQYVTKGNRSATQT